MQIEIPDGSYVHVSIGRVPMLALPPDGSGQLVSSTLATSPATTARPRYGLLAGIGLVLLVGGYTYGKTVGGRPQLLFGTSTQASTTAGTSAAVLPVKHAFPDRPLPRPTASPSDGLSQTQIPADFAQQLRQQPTVTPPPGQTDTPASGSGSTDAFGLHP